MGVRRCLSGRAGCCWCTCQQAHARCAAQAASAPARLSAAGCAPRSCGRRAARHCEAVFVWQSCCCWCTRQQAHARCAAQAASAPARLSVVGCAPRSCGRRAARHCEAHAFGALVLRGGRERWWAWYHKHMRNRHRAVTSVGAAALVSSLQQRMMGGRIRCRHRGAMRAHRVMGVGRFVVVG